jgi:chorismate dehydratase
MLQRGDIDVSPSSSFEYALNSTDYLLLPDYSISSRGPVKSVLLFSPYPLKDLQGRQIAITGESATSINLLRVLLLEYSGLTRVDDYVPVETVESLIENRQPALLIGDRAMRQAAQLPEGMHCYDLGEIWYERTGLPFVFALWIIRRESAAKMAAEISALQSALGQSLKRAFGNLEELAIKTGATPEKVAALVNYWQTINYALGDQHIAGFELFAELCVKHKLLKKTPRIEFFQPLLG